MLSSTGFILNRGKGLRQVCTECVSFPFCNLPAFWRIPIEYHELSWCRYLEKSIHCRENKNVTPAQWLQCVRRKRKFLYQRLNKSCFELQVISALPLWNITIGHGWKQECWSTPTSKELQPAGARSAFSWTPPIRAQLEQVTGTHRAVPKCPHHPPRSRICTPKCKFPKVGSPEFKTFSHFWVCNPSRQSSSQNSWQLSRFRIPSFQRQRWTFPPGWYPAKGCARLSLHLSSIPGALPRKLQVQGLVD